jgi:hypothetical protein
MSENIERIEWQVLGASVRGAAHIRAGQPKQDAMTWLPESGTELPLALAVADGHGSAKCFRSDVGAQLAVAIATQTVQEYCGTQPAGVSLSALQRVAEEQLPLELTRRWQSAVQDALATTPFSSEELARLEQHAEVAARQSVEANPLVAYGTTLLTVLVTPTFILYLQLGDGDILTVTAAGEVSRPLPKDERLFANETTSLCVPDAWQDMRVGFHVLAEAPPALILLATDGYANSFRTDAGFLQVGSDLLEVLKTDGAETVSEQLAPWLTETSINGSGDDITLGTVCRKDIIRQRKASPSTGKSDESANVAAGVQNGSDP